MGGSGDSDPNSSRTGAPKSLESSVGLGLGTRGRGRAAAGLEKWKSRVGKRTVSRAEAVSLWGGASGVGSRKPS